MSAKCLLATLGVAALSLLPLIPVLGEDKPVRVPDRQALAEKLVAQCARVREGDRVSIFGGVNDKDLLEELAVQVRKTGGHPLVILIDDKLTRRLIDEVPARFDEQRPEMLLKMAEIVDVQFIVESYDREVALAGIPPERRAAFNRSDDMVQALLRKRNVRQVSLGNGLYPLPTRAKRFGVSEEALARVFWDGLQVDYKELQATGQAVRKIMTQGKQIRLTHLNGTDLTLGIAKRPVFISDGVISDDKLQRGGEACQVWLPAGEVYLAPEPGTAEGRVVFDRLFFGETEITGLVFTFKAGHLTGMEAKSGLEKLRAFHAQAGEGKNEFGYIDIGINPRVRLVPDSKMVAWMPAGMVTVGLGNNVWAGGDNASALDVFGHLPGCTLRVDDKVLIEAGTLRTD
jgi:leucyl aminopeptidase (aminopeptidase T)